MTRYFLIFFTFLIISPGSYCQSKPYSRVIFIKSVTNPVLYRIAEEQPWKLWYPGQNRVTVATISRIRGDSIYIEGAGFRFAEIDSIDLSAYSGGAGRSTWYYRSDSAKWTLIYPPNHVYSARVAYAGYLRSLNRKVHKDHVEWNAPPFKHHQVKFNFSRLLNMEIAFSYEYRFSRVWACEMEGAVQFNAVDPLAHNLIFETYPLYKYNGFSVYTGPKYYFNSRGYVQAVLQYRYMELDSALSPLPGGQERLLDEFRNDYGLSFRIGQITRLGSMLLDGYFGLGIKMVQVRQQVYGYYYHPGTSDLLFTWYNDQHAPVLKNYTDLWPVINIGIKIGIGI